MNHKFTDNPNKEKCPFCDEILQRYNDNVYWEAGYAEALNKQAIYACENSFFDGEKRPFDIRHKRSIKWDKNKLTEAAKELKGVIRGTFPNIAQLENGTE